MTSDDPRPPTDRSEAGSAPVATTGCSLAGRLRSARSTLVRSGFGALNQVVVPTTRAGLGNPLLAGVGPVVVETTGRRTGLRRSVPLLAVRVGATVHVATVRPTSLWMRNLQATPAATVWLQGRPRAATATSRRLPGLQVATLRLAP